MGVQDQDLGFIVSKYGTQDVCSEDSKTWIYKKKANFIITLLYLFMKY